MQINVSNLISMSEANQNFSKVARLVDENGAAIILKNNVPRYVLIDFSKIEKESVADDTLVENVAIRFLQKHRSAFELLN